MKPTNKLMKRLSLYLFLIFFSLQTPSWADDIRDFQIEGMSIGDSLLDYFSMKTIENEKKDMFNYPNSNKYTLWVPSDKSYGVFEGVQFHFKTNDSKYIIHALDGHIYYFKNIKKCYSKKKEIFNDLNKFFPNSEITHEEGSHTLDKSGESKVERSHFKIKNGHIYLECYDWGKKLEKKYGDKLSLSLRTEKIQNWLMEEAFD